SAGPCNRRPPIPCLFLSGRWHDPMPTGPGRAAVPPGRRRGPGVKGGAGRGCGRAAQGWDAGERPRDGMRPVVLEDDAVRGPEGDAARGPQEDTARRVEEDPATGPEEDPATGPGEDAAKVW